MPEQLLFTAAASFEAARELTRFPAGHRARRLHGHSFVATVRARNSGASRDFAGGEAHALQRRLIEAVAPLDYAHLNATLEHPTDENIARWIAQHLDLEGVASVGVQSTAHAGTDLDAAGRAHVWRRYAFEAAHRLPHVPPGHKCARLHGHGFQVILHARPDAGVDTGTAGHDRLDALWAPLHDQLDHACLNDIPGLENPTSELIARWITDKLRPRAPALAWVTVYETAYCGAHFDGRVHHIWHDLNLDSALRLERAPEGDRRRRVHGHTYTLRLGLSAPLDAARGWTLDFGEVKEAFRPVFLQLDHQPLHEVLGVCDPGAANLVRWIRKEAAAALPRMDRLELYETRGCGAILAWGDAAPALPV